MFLLTALAMALPTYASKSEPPPRLIVTINLSKNSITLQKNTRKSHSALSAWLIPIATGTIKPGEYKLLRMTERYRSQNGNVFLENVLRTDGEFNLRTTRRFEEWIKSERPANHAVVMDAETGSLLFTLVQKSGLKNTLVRVIP